MNKRSKEFLNTKSTIHSSGESTLQKQNKIKNTLEKELFLIAKLDIKVIYFHIQHTL